MTNPDVAMCNSCLSIAFLGVFLLKIINDSTLLKIKVLFFAPMVLLESLVPQRTFNVHGNFPFHRRFFLVEKDSLDLKMFLDLNIFILRTDD